MALDIENYQPSDQEIEFAAYVVRGVARKYHAAAVKAVESMETLTEGDRYYMIGVDSVLRSIEQVAQNALDSILKKETDAAFEDLISTIKADPLFREEG